MKCLYIKKDFGKIFIILSVCYCIINFSLLPHNHLISYPIYIDDFNAFTYTFDSITWHTPRPVFFFLAAFFSQLHIAGYYFLLLVSIIFFSAMVFYFTKNYFLIALPKRWIILYGVLTFSYPFIIEISKNLGLMINLCAGLFALIGMLFLLKGHRENKILFFILSALFYILSIFAKEDFILPGLILTFYLWVFEKPAHTKDALNIKMSGFALYAMSIVIALFLFDKYIVHSAFTGMNKIQAYPYQVNIHFFSIMGMMRQYLTSNSYQLLILAAIFFILLFGLMLLKTEQKIKMIFFVIIIVSLVLPYSVLPHHFIYDYTYNWLPFEVALMVFGLFLLSKNINQSYNVILLSVICIMAVSTSYAHRHDSSLKLETSARINKNIISTLEKYKNELNLYDYIGVTGIKDLPDRLEVSANYVNNILGIKSKWIIFQNTASVKKNSIIYLYFTIDGKGKFLTSKASS
jgi:hypothetical protein